MLLSVRLCILVPQLLVRLCAQGESAAVAVSECGSVAAAAYCVKRVSLFSTMLECASTAWLTNVRLLRVGQRALQMSERDLQSRGVGVRGGRGGGGGW